MGTRQTRASLCQALADHASRPDEPLSAGMLAALEALAGAAMPASPEAMLAQWAQQYA